MSKDLIVSDEYIKEMASYVDEQGDFFERMLSDYIQMLTILAQNGFTSGKYHKGLLDYVDVAKTLKGDISEISKRIQMKLLGFQKDIDERDKYLY